jgi:pyruvate/2-oxoglutarate dehydrogenase complex dihydrolipoamide acyltransferase (E2) component
MRVLLVLLLLLMFMLCMRPCRSLATPAVRAIAKANNLDILTVEGSGKSGRVMKEDVLRVLSGKVRAAVGHDAKLAKAHEKYSVFARACADACAYVLCVLLTHLSSAAFRQRDSRRACICLGVCCHARKASKRREHDQRDESCHTSLVTGALTTGSHAGVSKARKNRS